MLNGGVVALDGALTWYKDDLLHREDGPALHTCNGYQQWVFNFNE